MHYEKRILKNGLRVILAPVKEAPTATVLILTGTGSRYETKENNGISHFLEHLFFKGTQKRPTTLDIATELDSIGGLYNAFTGKDRTGYWAKTSSENVHTALDIMSDVFLNAKFEAKEINKERGAIIQEMRMYEDMPGRRVEEIFENLLYGDHPLGWDIVGPEENIKNLKRSDFMSYLDEKYRAENIVVCVAGGFDQEKTFSYIEKNFSHIPNNFSRHFETIHDAQESPKLFIKNKKTDQTHFMVGVRTFDRFHKDRYALSLLSGILGGGMSSRLFIQVRERRGLAYRVSTGVEAYDDAGYLATYCGVEHKNLEKALQVILSEYKKIARNGVDAKELKKAKEHLKGSLAMGLESSDDIASFLADQEILRSEITLPDTIVKRVDRVKMEDIKLVAREIFKSDRLNFSAIGPDIEEAKIKELLKL
ncbi:MAG: insulinase family protein [Candidatus Moraniibacteriota bacterium]|nr:MAG: insulinase family protein [Candidatus Moranbacteria bacterium]